MSAVRAFLTRWGGLLFIPWCGAMFLLVLGLGLEAFLATVVEPSCRARCEERGTTLARLHLGTRSVPATCDCADGARIETSLPDLGMFLGVLVFLPACIAPVFLLRAPTPPQR